MHLSRVPKSLNLLSSFTHFKHQKSRLLCGNIRTQYIFRILITNVGIKTLEFHVSDTAKATRVQPGRFLVSHCGNWPKSLTMITLHGNSMHLMKQDKICFYFPTWSYIKLRHAVNMNANECIHKGDSFSPLDSVCTEWVGSLLSLAFALRWKLN